VPALFPSRARRLPFRLLAAALLAFAHPGTALRAQTWDGLTSASLSEPTNWTEGTVPANNGTAALTFGAATNYNLSVDASLSVYSLSFTADATTGYRLDGSGNPTLTIGAGGFSDNTGRSLNSNGGFTMALPQAITYHFSGGTSFANWPMSGSGSITKTGAGTIYMASGNSNNLAWSGALTLTAGTLGFNNDNKLGAVPSVATPGMLVLNGGTLYPTSSMTIAANRGIAVTANSTISLGSLNTLTYGGVMTGSAGLTGSRGTLVLSGTNTYSGTYTVGTSHTLKLSGASTLAQATLAVTGGTLSFGVNATTVGALSGNRTMSLINGASPVALSVGNNHATTTYSGVISNTGSLAKIGNGIFTLSGNNTYSGGTVISAGTLRASNSTGSATGSGAVTVNSGGTLAGTGIVSGATTLNSGGRISPGNSPGTLATGSQTWAGGAAYVWEINNATGVSGTNYDLLSISGTLTVNATSSNRFTFSPVSLLADHSAGAVANFSSGSNYTYTVVTTTGGILGFDAAAFTFDSSGFTNSLGGGAWSLALANSNKDLQLSFTAGSAIPEPSTYAAIFGAAALALAAHRRRSRAAGGKR
jgi:autotransporter-associated beta strand protein